MIKIAVLDDYQNIFHEFIDIEQYNNVNLDPDSPNYISRKINDVTEVSKKKQNLI